MLVTLTRRRISWYYLLLAISFFNLTPPLPGQSGSVLTIAAESFGTAEGLSHRYVTGIKQDGRGLIWISTRYGLNRFDGYNFKWYTEERDGLRNNQIDHLYQDGQERLWLVHSGSSFSQRVESIDVFDTRTETVRSFEEVFGERAPFSPIEVRSIYQGENGRIIIFTPKKIVIYTDRFVSVSFTENEAERDYTIYEARNGDFWLSRHSAVDAKQTLLRVDQSGSVLKEFSFSPVDVQYFYGSDAAGGLFTSLSCEGPTCPETPQRFLYISPDGRIRDDKELGALMRRHDVSIDYKGFIHIDRNRAVWTLSHDGRFMVLPQDDGQSPLILTDKFSALKETIDLLEDRAGNVWVGTQFGLYQFRVEASPFRTYLTAGPAAGSERGRAMRGLAVTENAAGKQLWAVEENPGKLWRVDLNSAADTLITEMNGFRWAVSGAAGKFRIYNHGNQGIDVRLPEDGELEALLPFNVPNDEWGLSTIHTDKYGKIWFDNIFRNSLHYFDQGQQFEVSPWIDEGGAVFVYQISEGRSDTAWVATSHGMVELDIRDGSVVRQWRAGGPHELPYDHVHHFISAGAGSFWLATGGGGLVRWHPEEGILRRFTRADGLPDNFVYAVYPDEFGNLWLPTNHGISVLDLTTETIRVYTTTDGISHSEFNRTSHCRDEEGNLYFGSLDGVTAFHPRDLVADTTAGRSPLVLTAAWRYDAARGDLVDQLDTLLGGEAIVMNPDDPFVRLEFALLTYSKLREVRYAYRLSGAEEWNYQREASLRLDRLPYGKHEVIIRGISSVGQGSANELVVPIVVLKPFYVQGWFLAGVLIILSSLIVFAFRWRERNLREQKVRLERKIRERTETINQQTEELRLLDQMKTRFFANVSHELRTPLTLILGPLNSVLRSGPLNEKQRYTLNMVRRSGEDMRKLVSKLLDFSKLEHGKLKANPQPLKLGLFLNRTVAGFDAYAASVGVTLTLDYQGAPDLWIDTDADKLETILNNLLSNAIKFTPEGGAVVVVLEDRRRDILLSVRDTGRGISDADLPHVFDRFYQSRAEDALVEGGTGIGLSFSRELTKILGGHLRAESTPGKGSTFYLELPRREVNEAERVQAVEEEPRPLAVQPASAPASAPKNKSGPVPLSGTPPTILVVEDNVDLRTYLQGVLANRYRVLTARHGGRALKVLDELRSRGEPAPDLILSDLMMPVVDGHRLVEQLRDDRFTSHIPIVMLTAKARPESRLRALRTGVDDYLTKPFGEDELLVRIANLLERQAVRRRIFGEDREKLAANTKEGAGAGAKKVEETPTVSENPGAGADSSDTPRPATNKKNPLAPAPGPSPEDQRWLDEFEQTVRSQLEDPSLSVPRLAHDVAMSQSTLLRQTKRLIGLSPNQYINELRLDKARQLLGEKPGVSVAKVAKKVGYANVRSFSRSFRGRFGVVPSRYNSN